MPGCAFKGRHVRRRAFIELWWWSILERWKVAGGHIWLVGLVEGGPSDLAGLGLRFGGLHRAPYLLGRETDFLGDFLDVEVVFEPTSNRRDQWAELFKGIDLCLDTEASARFKFGERRLNDSLGTLKGGLKC